MEEAKHLAYEPPSMNEDTYTWKVVAMLGRGGSRFYVAVEVRIVKIQGHRKAMAGPVRPNPNINPGIYE